MSVNICTVVITGGRMTISVIGTGSTGTCETWTEEYTLEPGGEPDCASGNFEDEPHLWEAGLVESLAELAATGADILRTITGGNNQ